MSESNDQPEIAQLVAMINAAFADVQLSGGYSLHQAEAIDFYESDEQVAAARGLDKEADWREISDEKIEAISQALAFMDPEGYRFHLPRFIVFSLLHGGDSASLAVDAPIYSCAFSETLRAHQMQRQSLLNSAQRSAVAAYLKFAAAHDESFDAKVAAEALADHWAAFA